MSQQRSNNSATSCCTSECEKRYGKCPPPDSLAAVKDYEERLKEIINVFYLVLERYKDSYPLKMADPENNENVRLYNESKSQLDDAFSDLYMLESEISSNLDNLDAGVKEKDAAIAQLKTRYSVDKEELEKIRNSNLASYPMKREFEQSRANGYLDLAYYIVATIFIGFLFLKAIKGPEIPTAIPVDGGIFQAKAPFVTGKVAKISTLSAAIISGLIAAYYS